MEIGKHSYIAYNDIDIRFPQSGELRIGNYCSIAEDVVVLLGGEHNVNNLSTFPFDRRLGWEVSGETYLTKGDVTIGNDVWIGKGVIILSGRTIGDGAVVGAYSVVTKDIPAYEIWTGNPARFRRQRVDDYAKNILLAIRWWDWPEELIKEAAPLLTSNKIGELHSFWLKRIVK